MSEKLEKCPNCDNKLSGIFSSIIVEDEVIKELNEKIKLFAANDLEEKEAYCTGCLDDVEEAIGKFDPDLEEKRLRLEEKRLRIESDPKCPSCGIIGMDYITENPSNAQRKGGEPWFEIVACIKCGHVYGTLGGQ